MLPPISKLIIQLIAIFAHHLGLIVINMVKNRVFNAAKTKATIQNCPAVVFIALAESWVLMELSQNFIQRWHRSMHFHGQLKLTVLLLALRIELLTAKKMKVLVAHIRAILRFLLSVKTLTKVRYIVGVFLMPKYVQRELTYRKRVLAISKVA